MAKTQLRGHCSCCGRIHAVLKSGYMAKHGYTVEQNYFVGVCSGHEYLPMELQRAMTDYVIKKVREDVAISNVLIGQYLNGEITPLDGEESTRLNAPIVPFAQLNERMKERAIERVINGLKARVRAGNNFADNMAELVERVYGQPLKEVTAPPAPARIERGEGRVLNGRAVKCQRVDGARVYWKDERGFTSWTGTRAWRALPLAEQQPDVKND